MKLSTFTYVSLKPRIQTVVFCLFSLLDKFTVLVLPAREAFSVALFVISGSSLGTWSRTGDYEYLNTVTWHRRGFHNFSS